MPACSSCCSCSPAPCRTLRRRRRSTCRRASRPTGGCGTTIGFALHIQTPPGQTPEPLTAIALRYPAHLGVDTSGLGLATCSVRELERGRLSGCPPNSLMGYGSARALIPLGPEPVEETAKVAIFQSPIQNEQISLLFYVEAAMPVDAEILIPGQLVSAQRPFGGQLNVNVPVIPTIPEGPDVALSELNTTIGPQHIVYYERINGQTIAYHPAGILLPNKCPTGGFPFAAEITFINNSHTTSTTTIPCPTLHVRHPRETGATSPHSASERGIRSQRSLCSIGPELLRGGKPRWTADFGHVAGG